MKRVLLDENLPRGLVARLQTLRYQQNLTATDIAVVVVRAPTNRLEDLLPLTDGISEALGRSESGDVRVVPAD